MSDNIHVCATLAPIKITQYYRIALVQFWRGQKEPLRPYPLHWALYVETGPGVGNTYEIVGDQSTYTFRMTVDQPLANKEGYRGCCYLGRVSEAKLPRMGAILAKIEVFRNCPIWNSHDWVETALRTLRDSGFPVHSKEEVLHGCLQDEMLWQLEDWPGIEDVVEFVGYQYLECVIYSKSRRLRTEGQE
ncbi:uncharacterized protein F5891DRAFT_1195864 [Suillus fuscotomentosus]|uniref:Uncharacterized protein n=1 Tax=Suillus fuscotomentosus TaxID=1912939 RepID=A0AAD4DWE1_9AGAM|nr:uncharacterized protein F5891DRAFT_1195864 [Suillus fuscotomentosus]KAG1893838.1 hypothetical protein F5891DRAFT_1195864 [Suillus fuscotomentosus]